MCPRRLDRQAECGILICRIGSYLQSISRMCRFCKRVPVAADFDQIANCSRVLVRANERGCIRQPIAARVDDNNPAVRGGLTSDRIGVCIGPGVRGATLGVRIVAVRPTPIQAVEHYLLRAIRPSSHTHQGHFESRLFDTEGRPGQRAMWGIVGLSRRYPARLVEQRARHRQPHLPLQARACDRRAVVRTGDRAAWSGATAGIAAHPRSSADPRRRRIRRSLQSRCAA